MKKRTGLYPAVQADAAGCGVVSQAGGVALLETVRASGLDGLLREAVSPWRKPQAVHDPAKVLLDLAVALALGGDCLADIAVLRAEPGVYGRVASDPTVSRTIDALAADAPRALSAINGARATARAAVWQLAGRHAPDHEVSTEHPLVVDIDATLVTSHSDKEDARPTFKRGYGHHPLWAFADHGAGGTGEPLAVLRKGSANSARGAARLVADAVRTARAAGAGGPDGTGLIVLRADSAFYGYPVLAAARRAGARFSVTVRASPAVSRAVESIDETAWQPIHYPNAVWDEQAQCLVSDAEIAEVGFTAFTGRRKGEQITGRLLVRRVRRLNTSTSASATSTTSSTDTGGQQGELFVAYRYHAVFTDSPFMLVQAEKDHRGHAIIEQVHADLRSGPLAHLPSGSFAANSAWLVLAAIAFNLTRAAGCLASAFHARAKTSTLRTQLINVPARLARSARRLRLHLPERWPWEHAWQQLFQATLAPT